MVFPLSKFVPRHNSQYDERPAMNEVIRQPRCRECNKLYSRRRSLFNGKLSRLAEELGVVIRARPKSVFRVIEVKRSKEDRKVLRALRKVTAEFNDSLPVDRCEVDKHGVKVELAPSAGSDSHKQARIDSRSS